MSITFIEGGTSKNGGLIKNLERNSKAEEKIQEMASIYPKDAVFLYNDRPYYKQGDTVYLIGGTGSSGYYGNKDGQEALRMLTKYLVAQGAILHD